MRKPTVAPALAVVIGVALGGCVTPPPPAPGPTLEEFQALSANNESMARERTVLEVRLGSLEKQLDAQTRTTKATELETARLLAEIKRLEAERAILVDRLEEANTALSSLRFYTGPPKAEPISGKGTVLASDPKADIYWISIDPKDGIKVADELTVFRKDAFVAVVVVEEIVDKKARVVVKKLAGKPMLKSPIQVGDRVASAL